MGEVLESIRPMGAPLGLGGGRSRSGRGGFPTPFSLSPARLRGSAPPFDHLGDGRTFLPSAGSRWA